jgi:aspartate aminotransferase
LYDRTVTINGVSKSHAMTGWRIGYCGGPAEIVAAMATIQGQSTSNPSSVSQQAAIAALRGDRACIDEMTRQYRLRHDYLIPALNALPGVSCLPASGAFYAFADIRAAMSDLGYPTDVEFCDALLERTGVAVVPGSAFGGPGHMRLSFATSLAQLEAAVERMHAFLTANNRG